MRLTVIDEHGSLVAHVETESSFHEAPDGSAFAHVTGTFEPGPGFVRIRSMIDAFDEVYRTGDLKRALQFTSRSIAWVCTRVTPRETGIACSMCIFN
jgi:hypothetical protein